MQATSPAPASVPSFHRAVREMAYHALLACEAIDSLTEHRKRRRGAHLVAETPRDSAPPARG